MKKSVKIYSVLLTLGLLSISGCGNSKDEKATSTKEVHFKETYVNKKDLVQGGTLRIGQVSDTSFKGIFAPELSDDAITSSVSQFGNQSLFKYDNNYQFVKGGAADIQFDRQSKKATIQINPKVKWSDGQPLIAKDLIYAYKITANPKSGSNRYTESLENIKGMAEYHQGKSKEISGLEEKDNHTLVIHFNKMVPSMSTSGSGFLIENAEPYHYLKNIPMNRLVSSDQVRKHPLFYGPYKITNMVEGESIEWEPNPYYWQGKPKLDKIKVEVVSSSNAAASLKANKYDLLFDEPSSVYNQTKDLKKYVNLGKKDLYYSYLGFRVGTVNKDGKSVMNQSSILQNKSLRQAIGYAMNVDDVSNKLGYGVSYRATTLIPSVFSEYHDSSLKGFPYNEKKANELLDKAGFKKGDNGYRTTPEGKPLSLTLLAMSGSKNQEAIIKNYIQCWEKVGIKVKLYNGRLQEFNSFYDKLMSKADDFDLFMGAWSVGSSPEPNDLYAATAPYNYSHFVTKENTQLLNEIISQKAFSESYRKEKFYEWQKYMNKEAYVIPLQEHYLVQPVSKKVKNYTLEVDKNYNLWGEVGLTK